MKRVVIIQCASSKVEGAGSFKTGMGQIKFVAHPEAAPHITAIEYKHPDDPSDSPGWSWRQRLRRYNKKQIDNPLRLKPAYCLYGHPVYRELVNKLGVTNVFILSAGWGLVKADYLLPDYDITLKHLNGIDAYKYRRSDDRYQDFNHLPASTESIVYFGGQDYLPLLDKLTRRLACEKIVFFATSQPPAHREWKTIRFDRFTNWHYSAAREYLAGRLSVKP